MVDKSVLWRMLVRMAAALVPAALAAALMGCAYPPPDLNVQLIGAGLASANEQAGSSAQWDTYAEAAAALRELGIDGLTDECIKELEASEMEYPAGAEIDRALVLLSTVGWGAIDPETWVWTPSENGVYCFDAEVLDESAMYTDFLRGISAIGCGELEFTDIREDTSAVDWETGTGNRTVSFCWNGEMHILHARAMGDWFDADAAEQLSRIIAQNGGEKRLYFTSSGQECFVFYRDAGWAEAFSERTGIVLSDKAR